MSYKSRRLGAVPYVPLPSVEMLLESLLSSRIVGEKMEELEEEVAILLPAFVAESLSSFVSATHKYLIGEIIDSLKSLVVYYETQEEATPVVFESDLKKLQHAGEVLKEVVQVLEASGAEEEVQYELSMLAELLESQERGKGLLMVLETLEALQSLSNDLQDAISCYEYIMDNWWQEYEEWQERIEARAESEVEERIESRVDLEATKKAKEILHEDIESIVDEVIRIFAEEGLLSESYNSFSDLPPLLKATIVRVVVNPVQEKRWGW
ncbi:MAG: hypothetical protein U9M98_02590 [Patescibacteria group bacterium]|nr:hypothetical protein [Patescibacteria group bacterium]